MPEPVGISTHDHGNCALCDWHEAEIARLQGIVRTTAAAKEQAEAQNERLSWRSSALAGERALAKVVKESTAALVEIRTLASSRSTAP